jgi:hypothetical protein
VNATAYPAATTAAWVSASSAFTPNIAVPTGGLAAACSFLLKLEFSAGRQQVQPRAVSLVPPHQLHAPRLSPRDLRPALG